MKSFASDNYAGVLPEVMEALQAANTGHAGSYGNDEHTRRVQQLFREVFAADVEVFFVFNGTGANVLSMSAATQSWQSVLCADIAHMYNDESSAPETFTGCRFFPLPANEAGKLTPEIVMERVVRNGDIHYAQSAVLSLTQSTEYGTLYTPDELRALSALCRQHGLYLHVDGSRFFNAAASLGLSLHEISAGAGVDILSLGGTKSGMMYGEAVLVFNKQLAEHIRFKHKQSMQLASKTRFIAVQFEALLRDELWRSKASHANAMAAMLTEGLRQLPAVQITKPVQANVVFARIPQEWNEPLMNQYPFYVWKHKDNEVRLMCAWDTTAVEVEALLAAMKRLQNAQ
jgi:threonine aldolase